MAPAIMAIEGIEGDDAWTPASWGGPPPSASGGSAWKRMTGTANDDDSWEVRAFLEDTTIHASQWPPRSYGCSYCKRGFVTAQALGGHMNVHRRERQQAKLDDLRKAAASGSVDAVNAFAAELHRHLASPKRLPRDPLNAVDAATPLPWELPSPATPSRTAELLLPESLTLSLSPGWSCTIGVFPSEATSPPPSLAHPEDPGDIVSATLRLGNASPPYERAFYLKVGAVDLAKFATMDEDDDALRLDLELRLGLSLGLAR